MRRIISQIPNTITSLNLLSGCVAVVMAFRLGTHVAGIPALSWVYICIGAAAVFDFLDGFSARLLKAYSAMGKELDSLSDLVSFGVAPGMLMLCTMLNAGSPWWAAAFALLIPIFGALRLARFNVDDTQATTFKGLPIPANALFWIGFSAWMQTHGYPGSWVMVTTIIIVASSMMWSLRMFSLKFQSYAFADNIKRYGLVVAAAAFVAFNGISGLAWTVILYMLLSALTRNPEE